VAEQLVALKRERKALEGLLARQANGPSEQHHALRTCLDALEGATDKEKARQQVKMLLAGPVEKVGVYITAKGYRRRACFVVVKYRTGLFRRIVIAPDGTAVTVADGTAGLEIPLPEGWR
jgi:hypothetical protein